MKKFNVNDKDAIEEFANELLDDYSIVNIYHADGSEARIVERHVPESSIDMTLVETDECPFCYSELSKNKVCEQCETQFVSEPWSEY